MAVPKLCVVASVYCSAAGTFSAACGSPMRARSRLSSSKWYDLRVPYGVNGFFWFQRVCSQSYSDKVCPARAVDMQKVSIITQVTVPAEHEMPPG